MRPFLSVIKCPFSVLGGLYNSYDTFGFSILFAVFIGGGGARYSFQCFSVWVGKIKGLLELVKAACHKALARGHQFASNIDNAAAPRKRAAM